LIDDSDNARLVVRQRSKWIPEVQRLLHDARRDIELRALGLQPEVLEELLAEPALAVEFHEASGRAVSRGSPVTAIVFLVLVMVAVYLGNAYLFVGITGEKQQRITEQVLSAITPQTWIDGKILGLAAVAVASLAVTVLGFVLFSLVPALLGAALGQGDAAAALAATSAGTGAAFSDMAQASSAARDAWMQKLPTPDSWPSPGCWPRWASPSGSRSSPRSRPLSLTRISATAAPS